MRSIMLSLICVVIFPAVSAAQGKAAVAREAAEFVLERFGKEAAKEGIEGLTRKVEQLAIKHGDEAVIAFKNVGPRTFKLVEEAGEYGVDAVKIMAKYGDEAVWVVQKKNRMAIFIKYGDNAGVAMMRHGEIAEPLIEFGGKPAAGALKATTREKGGHWLARMHQEGDLSKIGRTSEVLDIIAKYGDRAAQFVWNNKGPLTVAAALAAFLADPEPFINGAADITKVIAENVGKPLANASGQIASEAAKSIDWTTVTVYGLCFVGALVGIKMALRRSVSPPSRTADHA